jgi:hypothetical protein
VSGRGRGEGRRKRGRAHGKEFMDAALDGYIRDIALQRWRDYEDLADVYAQDPGRALAEAGAPLGAGPYRELWQEAWRRSIWPGPEGPQEHLFARIERVVRDCLLAEREERVRRGDPAIEDTPGYKEFVSRALNNLYREASGEIEELD